MYNHKMNTHNHSSPSAQNSVPVREPKRLVLCFDGTGNEFTGTESDTNIVKFYKMCDRDCESQFHYYQPGIGTYSVNEDNRWLGKLGQWFSYKLDEAIATTFEQHVIAGYRFIMRYYKPGDHIYILGFSRGAFTARFLAHMIDEVGLLSEGNEEMVAFAFRTYRDFHLGKKSEKYNQQFMKAFCRPNAKIHFLGLFDTVNSVGAIEIPLAGKKVLPVTKYPAKHIRHAVSINERRLMFKPALFTQDGTNAGMLEDLPDSVDLKEVWFPGNHGDVGGGWEPPAPKTTQLSDIALEWMVGEIVSLGDPHKNGPGPLLFSDEDVKDFDRRLEKSRGGREDAIRSGTIHDVLAWPGWNFKKYPAFFLWNLMEYLPISRLELIKGDTPAETGWKSVRFPLNKGGTRDFPSHAVLHSSAFERPRYMEGVSNMNHDNVIELPKKEPSAANGTVKHRGGGGSSLLD